MNNDSHNLALNRALAEAGYAVPPHGAPHRSQLINPRADRDKAIDAYTTYLHAVPHDISAHESLAYLFQLTGHGELALKHRTQAVGASVNQMNLPADQHEEMLAVMLAREGLAPQPATLPTRYVVRHFDRYADGFDDHLAGTLDYQGPEHLLSTFRRVAPVGQGSLDILDLGCGTGLSGAAFRPLARKLLGIDVSAAMLDKAAQKGIYDELLHDDLANAVTVLDAAFDLILAADVFIYVGELESVFSRVRDRLTAGGWLVFSVEKGVAGSYRLQRTGRYTHSLDYLQSLAQEHGLAVREIAECVLRMEENAPVAAYSVVMQAI
ncbi:MAG: methyltransferase [Gammaproteobacteria bacterium]